MTIHDDPEDVELQTILSYIDFKDKTIIEIGCGNGRLTFKFAHQAKKVTGIDPSEKDIKLAIMGITETLKSKLEFKIGVGEKIPSDESEYDIVLFSSSLCCIDSLEKMHKALDEAWRVLKSDGILINLQPTLEQSFNRGVIRYLITNKTEDLVFADGWYKRTINARFALKYKTLIEYKYDLVKEESYVTKNYIDSFEEVLDFSINRTNAEATKLDQDIYQKIRKYIETMKTPDGYQFLENRVITILRKIPL